MIKSKLVAFVVLVCAGITNAQTPGEEFSHNTIFPRFFGWDVRVGVEKNTFNTSTTNTITNQVESTYNGSYKNSRLVVDALTVQSAFVFGKGRFKVGIPYGTEIGFAIQTKKYTDQYSGPNPYSSWPSSFRGNQGMEIGEKLALNFEMKAGLGFAYNIIPEKNVWVSVAYSYRFWSKANLGFYALPKFFGGFIDMNLTYKRWHLNTVFRTSKYDSGFPSKTDIKTGYFSIMPAYNLPLRNKDNKFRNGLNTFGLRLEGTYAKSIGSANTEFYTSYYTALKARTFMMGIYFGFSL